MRSSPRHDQPLRLDSRQPGGMLQQAGGGAGPPEPQHIWGLFGDRGLRGAAWTRCCGAPLAPAPPSRAAWQLPVPCLQPAGSAQPGGGSAGVDNGVGEGGSGLVDQFVIFLFCCGRNVRDANIKSPGKSPLQQSLVV